jgi:uncharacterized protein (DUF433 family)
MRLEHYFDFLAPDDIRLKGSRVGIESILYEYIYHKQTPETLQARFPTLTLEQIYATILYYLHNREKVETYLLDWLAYSRQAREEQERNPPPIVLRLRALAANRQEAALPTL